MRARRSGALLRRRGHRLKAARVQRGVVPDAVAMDVTSHLIAHMAMASPVLPLHCHRHRDLVASLRSGVIMGPQLPGAVSPRSNRQFFTGTAWLRRIEHPSVNLSTNTVPKHFSRLDGSALLSPA